MSMNMKTSVPKGGGIMRYFTVTSTPRNPTPPSGAAAPSGTTPAASQLNATQLFTPGSESRGSLLDQTSNGLGLGSKRASPQSLAQADQENVVQANDSPATNASDTQASPSKPKMGLYGRMLNKKPSSTPSSTTSLLGASSGTSSATITADVMRMAGSQASTTLATVGNDDRFTQSQLPSQLQFQSQVQSQMQLTATHSQPPEPKRVLLDSAGGKSGAAPQVASSSSFKLALESEDEDDAPVRAKARSTGKKSGGKKRVLTDDSDESGNSSADSDSDSSEFSGASESESSESDDSAGFVTESDDDAPAARRRGGASAAKKSAPAKAPAPARGVYNQTFTTPQRASPASKTPIKAKPSPSTPEGEEGDDPEMDDEEAEEDDDAEGGSGHAGGAKGAANFTDCLPKFVLPQYRRDAQGRRPDHPDFDPKTLYVPPEAMRDMSPAQKQYWMMKAENMDVVLFFKVGKFYELFDQDAEIGIKELNLIRMSGDRLHAGFPEVAFAKYAEILIRKGYRIGRVEQTQTPLQLKEENNALPRGQPKSQVVRREMCAIVTKSTVVDPNLLAMEPLSVSQSSAGSTTSTPSTPVAQQSQERGVGSEPAYLFAVCDRLCDRTEQEAAIELEHEREMKEAAMREESGIVPTDQSVKLTRSAYIENDVVIGVCFVDTAVGAFHVGHFYDNKQRTKLRTLLTQLRPAEILTANGNLTDRTKAALDAEAAPDALRTTLRNEAEFWTADASLHHIYRANYFNHDAVRKADEEAARAASIPGNCVASHKAATAAALRASESLPQGRWPGVLRSLKEEYDNLKKRESILMAPGKPDEVVTEANQFKGLQCLFSSLGAVMCYLQRLLIDRELVSLGNFYLYDPKGQVESSHMILDGQTLQNLEILHNQEGGTAGTLLKHLDHTATPFGRRLLRTWVARPLGRVEAIERRLDAVEDLMANADAVNRCRQIFKKLPDLERMLTRVRANGIKKDNAVMFENVGKQKVEIFIKTLNGFELALKGVGCLRDCNFKSSRLRRLVAVNDTLKSSSAMTDELARSVQSVTWGESGNEDPEDEAKDGETIRMADVRCRQLGDALFPQLEELLDEFRVAFNHQEALSTGHIVPKRGVVPEFDAAKERVAEKERALQQYLHEQRQALRCSSMSYYHRARERYQLEISVDALKSVRLPSNYEQMSQTKQVRRFWTPEIKRMLAELEAAEALRESLLTDVTRQVFNKFGQDYPLWAQALGCIAEIDCLMSLSIVSAHQQGNVCRPKFIRPSLTEPARLEIRDGVHPVLASATASQSSSPVRHHSTPTSANAGPVLASASTFISNDVDLGTTRCPQRFVLVSGPNMGGKSTLLRQVCLTAIMAQIGCYVPASSCVLTPVDRIFTRVGANDRIMQGQSTFLVELEETATILRHATNRSLVILDELGRGTSTFDGTAIAHSVIEHLADKVGCLTLFSTHYHMLLEEFKDDPRVARYHMECVVQNKTAQEIEAGASPEIVIFKYKFIPGVCSKSFGMNVASLVGLPSSLVHRAKNMSELFEKTLIQAHRLKHPEESASEKQALLREIQEAIRARDMAKLSLLQAKARAILAQA